MSKFTDGQYGAILIEISAQGIQKHSALIENSSENAIHQVTEVLAVLGERKFPAWNVGTIRGGLAKNIVALGEGSCVGSYMSEVDLNLGRRNITSKYKD